ncbi:MAG: stage II sporulation protein E (SpoIIE) [Deltaproteobacteria bacterium]|nr:MAG: stage II sporulation protein E (SpoIIE) [Deltaproteobacteria bacterium]
MTPLTTDYASCLDWKVASRPFPGERTSGDLHLVEEWRDGALVAVVDGVGHGEEAAFAARRATETLRAHCHDPLVALVSRCHRAMFGTRGAVMSVARFDAGRSRMSWLGVGNVEGVLLRATGAKVWCDSLLRRAGALGQRPELPSLDLSEVAIVPGDLLILATDGIRPDFVPDLKLGAPPEHLADGILAEYARDTDDGLVLVARYRGP